MHRAGVTWVCYSACCVDQSIGCGLFVCCLFSCALELQHAKLPMRKIHNRLQFTPCSVHKALDVVLLRRLGKVDDMDILAPACGKVG